MYRAINAANIVQLHKTILYKQRQIKQNKLLYHSDERHGKPQIEI